MSKSVRDAGLIKSLPQARESGSAAWTPMTVILVVGVDLSLSRSQDMVWQAAGYSVTPARSIRDAIVAIRYGDFDVVLMGDSIALCDRERLTFLIRASGSRVPVVCMTDSPGDCEGFAFATARCEPNALLQSIRELLAAEAGKIAANGAVAAQALLIPGQIENRIGESREAAI